MDTLFKFAQEPLEKMGVDLWWTDYWFDGKKLPRGKIPWTSELYTLWVNEAYFRHSERRGLRGQDFTRWGDWGDHRHPILFSGDTWMLWPTLEFEVPFTANSGNTGAFFWSHDIGGYQGEADGELLARWAQFGAFSAALRVHSKNMSYVSLPPIDKRPWIYDKMVEDSMRASYHLRSMLFPYVYSSARQSSEESVPLSRPLYFESPAVEEAYHNPQEYLYGDAFLVAPITKPGTGPQKVWFPDGVWYDWFTGERFEGGTQKEFSKGLDSFPLFARGGVPIPMQPYAERMATEPLKTLVVRVYPGEQGRFDLYEDDGLTQDYLSGHYGLTPLSYRRNGARSP